MEFKYQKVEVNPEQRIFVFGDLHGSYHLVEKAFRVLGIRDEDVKVFVGDYCDRSSQNIKCFEKVQPHFPYRISLHMCPSPSSNDNDKDYLHTSDYRAILLLYLNTYSFYFLTVYCVLIFYHHSYRKQEQIILNLVLHLKSVLCKLPHIKVIVLINGENK